MGNKTALVVDDSKSARFALRKYLESHAYHVDTAESAEEAFSFLKSHRPDLIFLDHIMPGTDGFEALQHLKADPQIGEIPVVICSSNEGADFTSEARSRGAAEVLQKPPSPDRLARILDNLQELSASLRQPPPAPKPAAPAETGKVPPQAPSKVANIREPDVAIEQVVMNALRHSLPQRPETAPAPAFNPGVTGGFTAQPPPPPATSAPPAFKPSATGSFQATTTPPAPQAGAPRPEVTSASPQYLREQIEARMKKLTQDVFMQIAELKGSLAHVESQLHAPEEDEAQMQQLAELATAELRGRIEALEQGAEAQFSELRAQLTKLSRQLSELGGQIEAALGNQVSRLQQVELALQERGGYSEQIETALQNQFGHLQHLDSAMHAQGAQLHQIESALQAQGEHIHQVAQAARAAAHEEAQAAAERTVMSAASRIADRLAESILKALGR